jgi:hypothetical protein
MNTSQNEGSYFSTTEILPLSIFGLIGRNLSDFSLI